MFSKALISALCGLSIISPVLAVPAPEPIITSAAANICNTDNCLRAFRAASPSTRQAEASSYCSSYLSTSVAAATVYTTTSTTATVTTSTATVTASTTVTEIDTTSLATTTTTTTTSYPPLPTITITITPLKEKREPEPSTVTVTPAQQTFPAYASQCSQLGTTGEAARVSSACSCLLKNPSTTTATVVSTVFTSITPLATSTPTTTTTTTTYTSTQTITTTLLPGFQPIVDSFSKI